MPKIRIRFNTLLFYFVIFLPFWMWLGWYLWPNNKLIIAIIDKTVLNKEAQEHASLTWILRQDKYSKTKKDLYRLGRDYYGFFPDKNKNYKLKGLERFSDEQLDKLSNDCDMLYITDTYGIYSKEWYAEKNNQRLLYGGLSDQDLYLLKKLKEKKKLIITEFNTFATPTAPARSKEFESLFKIKWTGWVGKYFDSFDTLQNKDLPKWLVENYKKQNNNRWPFKRSGVAFVNKNDKIVIVEYITHLNAEVPFIVTPKYQREQYNLPKSIKYPFWFDVIQTARSNNIVSFYDLKVNEAGMQMLQENDIPPQFPAIIEHNRSDYKFYYFAGDFADNPISQTGSFFKGIRVFRNLFYEHNLAAERASFFWEFYDPMVSKILSDYKKEIAQDQN